MSLSNKKNRRTEAYHSTYSTYCTVTTSNSTTQLQIQPRWCHLSPAGCHDFTTRSAFRYIRTCHKTLYCSTLNTKMSNCINKQRGKSSIDTAGEETSCSIALRVSRRKRKWRWGQGREEGKSERQQRKHDADICMIREKLGDYQHHGTGNPLVARSPTTPKDHAVRNLAEIIKNGVLGQPASESTPQLKTQCGNSSNGSFWSTRVRLTGSYGWTGIILPDNADCSKPFPVIEKASWFLVKDQNELMLLESLLKVDEERWKCVKDRLVTISQLAEHSRRSRERTRS